jgi:hypothetical protein
VKSRLGSNLLTSVGFTSFGLAVSPGPTTVGVAALAVPAIDANAAAIGNIVGAFLLVMFRPSVSKMIPARAGKSIALYPFWTARGSPSASPFLLSPLRERRHKFTDQLYMIGLACAESAIVYKN